MNTLLERQSDDGAKKKRQLKRQVLQGSKNGDTRVLYALPMQFESKQENEWSWADLEVFHAPKAVRWGEILIERLDPGTIFTHNGPITRQADASRAHGTWTGLHFNLKSTPLVRPTNPDCPL